MLSVSISPSLISLFLASTPANLVPNGDFEKGLELWKTYGDSEVVQTLTQDVGHGGGKSGKLFCAKFDGSGSSRHAMVAQAGTFPLKKDSWYKFSCWARAEGLSGGEVAVALSDTKVWDNAGLSLSLTPGADWKKFEVIFQATREITDNGRLQFWFGETGTFWLDDVAVEPSEPPHPVFTDRLPLSGSKNKIPNSSFELGSQGWSSLGDSAGWGNLSGLYGRVVQDEAQDGKSSLRIDLGPGKTVLNYFDYFDPVVREQSSPMAANLGWIPVQKNKAYTLSAWMKADQDGVPARLKVIMGRPMLWNFDHAAYPTLNKDWQRVSTSFSAMTEDLFVAAGPNLPEGDNRTVSVWLDALQLEEGHEASAYEAGPAQTASLPAPLPTPAAYAGGDSPFGVNHGFVSSDLLRKAKAAGLLWVRDWSLKWQEIEPKEGEFMWKRTDPQIDRVIAEGMKLICLLPPFPSSDWASSAPEKPDGGSDMSDHPRQPYAPKDPSLLGRFIAKTVEHYKDRVHVWEFLNEPLFTSYSLPEGKGYKMKDYVSLLKVARDAVKKADPGAILIGGVAGDPDNRTEDFINEGGLAQVDKLNLHIYPGLRKPESFIPEMEKLNAFMDSHGGRKPIWLTEYSYYGLDKKPWEPFISPQGSWAGERLLADEEECAEYSVRFAVIMLSQGVEKIFYHSGSNAAVNEEPMESCLLGREGLPRKTYVAQAVLAKMLGETSRFRNKAPEDGGVHSYMFSTAQGMLGFSVVWADPRPGKSERKIRIESGKVFDIMGNPVMGALVSLSSSPVYVTGDQRYVIPNE